MPEKKDKLPLKTFWEALERRLAAYSADELRAILRGMAQETSPMERRTFLAKLEPQKRDAAFEKQLQQADLLADIDDWIAQVQANMEHADYWEEERGYSWGEYYSDEDSLGPYEEYVEPLAALFDRTAAIYRRGNLTLARAAYQKLFGEALSVEDEYGRGVHADDLTNVDLDEARARYLRAVYETEPPARRLRVLLEQLRQVQVWFPGMHPRLNDLIEISPKPLPDRDRFMNDWIALLRKQNGADADAWLREAIRLAQGTPGLEELAHTEGKKRPRAFLDWVTALEEEGKHREALAAAQEALKTLPAKLPLRAAIADQLCAAASKLGKAEIVRLGRWEAFAAKPTLARLLDLWDSAPSREARTRLMRQAAEHLKQYLGRSARRSDFIESMGEKDDAETPAWVDTSDLAHAYLLSGQWHSAHQLAAREQVLGWSTSENPQGLVVSFFLVLLSRKPLGALPANLSRVWHDALDANIGFGYWAETGQEEKILLKRVERAYAEVVDHASLSPNEQDEFLSWCLQVARRRVDKIVKDQHRKSYAKAAALIAACAEVLRLRKHSAEADALLDQVRNRFPHHRAFQSELNAALHE
jgi:hypothetical protein